MKLTIVPEDRMVSIDGVALFFDYSIAGNIHAVQWGGTAGYIEYKTGEPNSSLDNIDQFQDIITLHNTKKTERDEEIRRENEADQTRAETRATLELTYGFKRSREYPPIGDQLDMLWHAMDTGVLTKVPEFYDAIKAVKDRFPST